MPICGPFLGELTRRGDWQQPRSQRTRSRASAFLEQKRGDVVGEKSFGAGAEQELFTLRDGDGLLLTTVKWASASGKPFLGEDRSHSGVAPSVEVKRPELADAIDPEDL